MSASEDWTYPCSDDEILQSGGDRGEGEWTPPGPELEALYAAIEAAAAGGGTGLTLDWRSPGRRAPGEAAGAATLAERPMEMVPMPANTNFDFMEDLGSLRLRMRREGEDTLRGSAKKKTSSFDGIVSNMMRHKRIQQMEREADHSSTP
ncbi:PTIP binding protein Pa1 [Arctopsyche grandis]|uniref:PTIP binding protein Pa1 n=1 Tax=Arctopsyche grandis TaxID=121162 RepID=UPI00406D7FF9